MVDPSTVAVGDVVEATADASIPQGVYRVVGTPDGALVCLRLTDDAGRRANTGELVRVGAGDATALEPATEPRSGAVAAARNLLQGPYWLLRSLLPV
jgi:hypothetical protein